MQRYSFFCKKSRKGLPLSEKSIDMWLIKWILAIYGYRHGGFWMMIWFFFLGTMIEGFFTRKKRAKQADEFFQQQANYQRRYQRYRQTYQRPQEANSLRKAYQTLGVPPTATDDEVRQAYRKHAMQNHPDRVAQMSEEIRQVAHRKFQEVTEAKDLIFRHRGI